MEETAIFEWTDETSMFDPNPNKFWGGDCYLVKYRVLIPKELEDAEESAIFDWIDENLEGVKWL